MAPQAGKSPYDVRSLKLAKPGQLPQTTSEMRQPEKVFRWLLEIIGAGKVRWAFTPGAANTFADWASRNPADERDTLTAIDEADDPLTVP